MSGSMKNIRHGLTKTEGLGYEDLLTYQITLTKQANRG